MSSLVFRHGRHLGQQGRAGLFNRRSGHCLKVLAGVGPELFEAVFAYNLKPSAPLCCIRIGRVPALHPL
jgi:hypothetical protein